MTVSRQFECYVVPNDSLQVEVLDKLVGLTVLYDDMEAGSVVLSKEQAIELAELLIDRLGDWSNGYE